MPAVRLLRGIVNGMAFTLLDFLLRAIAPSGIENSDNAELSSNTAFNHLPRGTIWGILSH
jgi:hypothetical protein